MKALILTLTATLMFPPNGQTQPLDMPSAGMRLRLTVTDATGPSRRMTGTVSSADTNRLALLPKEGAAISVPWSSVTSLELHRGRRSLAKRGAIVGTALLGILGAVYVALPSDGGTRGGSAGQVFGGGAFCGAAGALAGALVSAPFRVDRWQHVPLRHATPVSVVLRQGGIQIRAAAKF